MIYGRIESIRYVRDEAGELLRRVALVSVEIPRDAKEGAAADVAHLRETPIGVVIPEDGR